ncbi:hypothetical protein V8V91_02520 [Algoriphagus halophilus]
MADLVILDKNPLKVDVEDIKDIMVMETIKEGETVFKKWIRLLYYANYFHLNRVQIETAYRF